MILKHIEKINSISIHIKTRGIDRKVFEINIVRYKAKNFAKFWAKDSLFLFLSVLSFCVAIKDVFSFCLLQKCIDCLHKGRNLRYNVFIRKCKKVTCLGFSTANPKRCLPNDETNFATLLTWRRNQGSKFKRQFVSQNGSLKMSLMTNEIVTCSFRRK